RVLRSFRPADLRRPVERRELELTLSGHARVLDGALKDCPNVNRAVRRLLDLLNARAELRIIRSVGQEIEHLADRAIDHGRAAETRCHSNPLVDGEYRRDPTPQSVVRSPRRTPVVTSLGSRVSSAMTNRDGGHDR